MVLIFFLNRILFSVTNNCVLSLQLYIKINRTLVTASLQQFHFSQILNDMRNTILSIFSDPNTYCLQLLWRTTYSYFWDGCWGWNTGSTGYSFRSCKEGMLVLKSRFLIGFVEIWCDWYLIQYWYFISPLIPLCK
jgi:hypothetical protein